MDSVNKCPLSNTLMITELFLFVYLYHLIIYENRFIGRASIISNAYYKSIKLKLKRFTQQIIDTDVLKTLYVPIYFTYVESIKML